MSLDNKVVKNISFRKDGTKLHLEDNFLSRDEVNNVLTDNMGQLGRAWFKFQTAWAYNAYSRFKDMDKYLTEHGLGVEHKYYDPTKALSNRECGLHG